MLKEKQRNECKLVIQSAIDYCNNELLRHKGKQLYINYEIRDEIAYNAHTKVMSSKKDSCDISFCSEIFERTYNTLNVLLCEGNKTFYTKVSHDEIYDLKKANAYLDLLFEFCTKVIIFHELGHMYDGHLGYKLNRDTTSESYLYVNSNKNNLPPLESQALEMDADAFAANRLVGQLTYPKNIEKLNLKYENLIKNKVHAFILVVIASCTVFSIEGLGWRREKVELNKAMYLPLRTRQDTYMKCALNAFKHFNPETQLNLDEQIVNINFLREILPNIEQYVNLYNREMLGFLKIDYDCNNSIEEMSDKCLIHCKLLDAFWSIEMRKKLIPYSYYNLAD